MAQRTARSLRRRMGRLVVGVLVVSLLASALLAGPAGATAPGNAPFQRTWERTDRPVGEGRVSRTWMWGPEAFTGVLSEPYVEAPGGARAVQYFDKSRMEITNPNGDQASPWYVTNGLLVVELVTGRLQTGDNTFVERSPAQVNVAGDADDSSGPTYATFGPLRGAAPRAFGALITARVDRAGTVSDDPTLAGQGVKVGYVDEATKHAIAAPFWAFMNGSGTVYEDGQYRTALLFENPFFATGRPITEAYWANVKVAGSYRDVLMQCFERRCLTYTPGNAAGFVVEAGNVGQHYFAWHYPGETPPVDPPTTPVLEYAFANQWGGYFETSTPFTQPVGIATGPSGLVYIVEAGADRVQQYTTDGFYVRQWGGAGAGDGQFDSPQDAAVDADGNVYVVDQNNHRVQKFDATGAYLGQWGGRGAGNGQFEGPQGIAISDTGRVFVADTGNDRVQIFTTAGEYIGQFGSFGTGDGQFNLPVDIAIDTLTGYAYVVDAFNHRVQRFYYPAPSGPAFDGKWGTKGAGDGQFDTPQGIAVDSDHNVYVADFKNNRVQKFASDGAFLTQWGATGTSAGAFDGPVGLAVDGQDEIYVVELLASRVQKFDTGGAYLDRWYGGMRGRFYQAYGLALDTAGNSYVTDAYYSRVVRFDPTGAWSMDIGGLGSGAGELRGAVAVVASQDGYLYVSDTGHSKIFKYTQDGTYITSWDQEGTTASQLASATRDAGDSRARKAIIFSPAGLALDADGYVYVADRAGNRVLKFTSDGAYLTQWGTTGSGDGQFKNPWGLAVHGDEVFVTDVDNYRVQVFSRDGVYLRQWGSYGANPGQFNVPMGIGIDGTGYVYVADSENNRVQKFTPDGAYLTQIDGASIAGGQLDGPAAVQVDAAGNVYILDAGNYRVLKCVPIR